MKQTIWTFVLFWSIPLTTGDVTVTCVLTSDCMLPCMSPYYDIIHWYKDGKPKSVHTFYDKADHLEYQDADFKGRTSLFNDQISRGNASLLLRAIHIQDEGRYKCYTATSSVNKEQFVWLKVKVPIKWVDIKMTSEGISCSTKDVFPKPKVSWYRDGSSEDKFTVNTEGDKERLFSLSSVLSQSDKENITYSCAISLGDESQNYIASLRKENVEIYPGQDATIHCSVSQENPGINTTLTFGESSITLNYSQTSQPHTFRGKTFHLAHDGTITIHNLDNDKDTGTYICESLTTKSRRVVHTLLQINSAKHHVGVGVGVGIAVAVGVIIVIAAIIYWKWRNKGQENGNGNSPNGNLNSHPMLPVQTSAQNSHDAVDTSQRETNEEDPLNQPAE